jgi:hypothetical protein
VLWNQIIKEALRRPSKPAPETGNFGAAKAVIQADREAELRQSVGSDREGEFRLRAVASTGNAVLDSFIDQHYERRTVTIARSKLHSMNRLNIAAFTNIKADFDIGWIVL